MENQDRIADENRRRLMAAGASPTETIAQGLLLSKNRSTLADMRSLAALFAETRRLHPKARMTPEMHRLADEGDDDRAESRQAHADDRDGFTSQAEQDASRRRYGL